VILGNDVEIGQIESPASVPLVDFPLPAFPPLAGHVHLEPDTFGSIGAGAYQSVHVKSRATLTLNAGEYFIGNLTLEPQSVIRTTGPVTLFVQNHFIDRGQLLGLSNGSIVFGGTNELVLESSLVAELIAPNARVTLRGTLTTAHAFARELVVDPDREIVCEDSLPAPLLPSFTDGAGGTGGAPGGGSGSVCNDPAYLADHGAAATVSAPGCVLVTQYPSWWGLRNMKLQSMGGGSGYPIELGWENECTGLSGSGTLDSDWDELPLGSTSDACTTQIFLLGTGASTTLRYYAN
jgi:hypothetical protein